MIRSTRVCLLAAAALACFAPRSHAGFTAERVATGLTKPTYATYAPGDEGALYIVQQRDGGSGVSLTRGSILRQDLTTGARTNFLTLTGLDTDTQGGLHSLAFHPDYLPGVAGSKFYVVALKPSGTAGISTSTLQEWTLGAGGTPQFSRDLIRLNGLQVNDATHAMDWIGFRPGATGEERDWLYVTLGDGGVQANEATYVNNAASLESLYGKMLRLDVSAPDAYPADANRNYGLTPTIYDGDADATDGVPGVTWGEVYYSGLRNPWRASFDRATGDIWIGDVGFGGYEEVNYLPGGVSGLDANGDPALPGAGAAAGIDFGWPRREGFVQGNWASGGPRDPDGAGIRPESIEPLHAHTRQGSPDSIRSITGGYVYRGPNQHPGIQGKYFWGGFDFPTPSLMVGEINPTGQLEIDVITAEVNNHLTSQGWDLDQLSSFAEDAAGNLYFIEFGDECSTGCTQETGWTGVLTQPGTGELYRLVFTPDAMPGDFNADGLVNAADYVVWRDTLGDATEGAIHNNGDGLAGVDANDWSVFRDHFCAGPAGAAAALAPEPAGLAACAMAAVALLRWRRLSRGFTPPARHDACAGGD